MVEGESLSIKTAKGWYDHEFGGKPLAKKKEAIANETVGRPPAKPSVSARVRGKHGSPACLPSCSCHAGAVVCRRWFVAC